ncbi:MAG: tRNA-dihydrouridine synthase family protein [Candidatus Aminicenantes bacterium]|nr:tRNA-dihydrouridine synthase family protein [Candidatus Aminicenantes bacterium]
MDTLKIGHLKIKYRAILSPLASLTDITFRRLLDEIGCAGYMVTEMISAEGIRRKQEKTLRMIRSFDARTPQFVQVFGFQPEPFVEAVKYIENETGFAGIDINMGCPATKVMKKGGGAALLKDPPLAGRIVAEIKKHSKLPLTVKIRLGFDKVNVFEMIKVLEQEGADAIVVHFRLKSDGYQGTAKWEYAPQIREKINTVLIGNGDIRSAAEAKEKLTVVDGVMIGRGGLANPLIFAEIAGEEPVCGGRTWDFAGVLNRLLELIAEYYEEKLRLPRVKAFTRFLFWGKKYGKKARQRIYSASTFEEAKAYFAALTKNDFNCL